MEQCRELPICVLVYIHIDGKRIVWTVSITPDAAVSIRTDRPDSANSSDEPSQCEGEPLEVHRKRVKEDGRFSLWRERQWAFG